MMKKILLFASAIITIAFFCTAFSGGDNTDYPGGSPGGYTGSPGDGHTCTACHGGSASSVTGWITSNVPADGYTPGTTYTITATATGSGRKGFEVSPQSVSGSLLGTLTPGSGNKLCNGNKAITHSSGVTTSSATWTFSWTAPAAGTGPVTFYGAFTVSEPVTKLTTMVVNENSTVPLSATATATPATICTGQSSQLGVNVTGGNPPYTFSWTSNPSGFTSGIQNPVVSPASNTTYTVQVGDGTSVVTSSITVDVTLSPVVTAGIDTTYCKDVVEIPLHGTASNSLSVAWTTSGDGTFSNTSALTSIYYPGSGDRSTGLVNLTLTASPISPCAGAVDAVRHILFDPCTGISGNQGDQSGIVLSPNPTTGMIFLDFSGLKDKTAFLTVFNNRGGQVLSKTVNGLDNSDKELDLSVFAKGLYYVKIKTNDFVKVQKVILY